MPIKILAVILIFTFGLGTHANETENKLRRPNGAYPIQDQKNAFRNFDGFRFLNDFYKGYRLKGTSFVTTILAEVNLQGADLREANFSRSAFYGGQLLNVKAEGAQFTKAKLFGVKAAGLACERCDFREAVTTGSDFTGANFSNARFEGADLSESAVGGAIFKNATYDQSTRLPFSEETAQKLGFVRSQK